MNRVALTMLATLVTYLPACLGAQDTTAAAKRAADSARTAQAAPTMPPPSSIDPGLARVAQQRAQVARILLLTNDAVNDMQNQLRKLDVEFLQAQLTMQAQRDQFAALDSALQSRSDAAMVVLVRNDGQSTALRGVTLSIDGANTAQRTYGDSTSGAPRSGAVDEIFRGIVLPTPHSLVVTAVVNGQTVKQSFRVQALPKAVTYVEFALRNGALVPSAWASTDYATSY